MNSTSITPGTSEAATTARRLGDKRAVAQLAGMSTRWVNGQMCLGMPYLAFGKRRVRFDLEEVAAWLRKQYHSRRNSPSSPPQQ